MTSPHLGRLAHIVNVFADLPEVRAIGLAGSRASGRAAEDSDFDLYIYTRATLTNERRLSAGRKLAPEAALVDAWGPAMAWDDPTAGAPIETMFFEAAWIEDQLEKVLLRHEASLGYSTCIWHTVRVSHVLHDPSGWFAEQQRAAAAPYPDGLRRNIIAHNLDAICGSTASYRAQIAKALTRRDWVSVNHRIAALLASVFDCVFAFNRQPHPGEKRLLEHTEQSCAALPEHFRELVAGLTRPSTQDGAAILATVDALIVSLQALLER